MTIVIQAPNASPDLDGDFVSVFLGGSIDMGMAEHWQNRLAADLSDHNDPNFELVLYNPRRDDWDSSWVQDPTPGTQFHEQVTWELHRQDEADIRVYYFGADSKAPITLLELGLFSVYPDVIICCPKTFYRYGNVKIVADLYDIKIVETYDEMLAELKAKIAEFAAAQSEYMVDTTENL